MNQSLPRPHRFFFGTRMLPCPYVPGRVERKVVTDLSGPNASALYGRLSRAGFRRSHGLAYRPACPSCSACLPVRVDVGAFAETRAFKRVRRANDDVAARRMAPMATVEQFRLFSRYQAVRHGDGDMASMTFGDYRAMIEETPVETVVVEFRDGAGALLAAMLADVLDDSLSAVYSFFDPRETRRSLGTWMILWLIDESRRLGLPHAYLGYLIEDSEKMAYKARFRPLERLTERGWETYLT